jgi:hypothetical protein
LNGDCNLTREAAGLVEVGSTVESDELDEGNDGLELVAMEAGVAHVDKPVEAMVLDESMILEVKVDGTPHLPNRRIEQT